MSKKTPIKENKPPEWANQLFKDIGDIKNQLMELNEVKESIEFIDKNIGKIQDRQNKEEKVLDSYKRWNNLKKTIGLKYKKFWNFKIK